MDIEIRILKFFDTSTTEIQLRNPPTFNHFAFGYQKSEKHSACFTRSGKSFRRIHVPDFRRLAHRESSLRLRADFRGLVQPAPLGPFLPPVRGRTGEGISLHGRAQTREPPGQARRRIRYFHPTAQRCDRTIARCAFLFVNLNCGSLRFDCLRVPGDKKKGVLEERPRPSWQGSNCKVNLGRPGGIRLNRQK